MLAGTELTCVSVCCGVWVNECGLFRSLQGIHLPYLPTSLPTYCPSWLAGQWDVMSMGPVRSRAVVGSIYALLGCMIHDDEERGGG